MVPLTYPLTGAVTASGLPSGDDPNKQSCQPVTDVIDNVMRCAGGFLLCFSALFVSVLLLCHSQDHATTAWERALDQDTVFQSMDVFMFVVVAG